MKARMITAWGETKTIADWSRDVRCSISYVVLFNRLKGGMDPETAISTPPLKSFSINEPVEVGDVFEMLEVIEPPRIEPVGKSRKSKVKCRCECGKETDVFVNQLRSGGTKSCGCLITIKTTERNKNNATHNMSRTKIYQIYRNMISRCYNTKNSHYEYYGARGITVCDSWKDSLEKFVEWAQSNGYDDKLTIERKDFNGNYCPENCTFATMKEQNNNTRQNVFIEAFGERKTLAAWASDQRCVVKYETLRYRVKSGWDHLEAITTPNMKNQFV